MLEEKSPDIPSGSIYDEKIAGVSIVAGDDCVFGHGACCDDFFQVLGSSYESNIHVEGRSRKECIASGGTAVMVLSKFGFVT